MIKDITTSVLRNYKEHLVLHDTPIKTVLKQLDSLAADAIVFVVNTEGQLLGSLTDGDVRRGLLKDLALDDKVILFVQPSPKFLRKEDYTVEHLIELRNNNFTIIPVVDEHDKVLNVLNFRFQKSFLPVDAIIMAGGKGTRLMPLTKDVPKPLLKVGEKPIIEHNVDRLAQYGIDQQFISIKYLGEQLVDYFGDGVNKGLNIQYIREESPLGTIGALRTIKDIVKHDCQLVMNSDLLTNIDYEAFYSDFMAQDADLIIATVPYDVNVPYAVLETEGKLITSFKEKPTYTYYSNAGIYLMKKEVIDLIPENEFFNATDLMEKLIALGKKVVSFPIVGYWLDIGKHRDFVKANEDIKKIKL